MTSAKSQWTATVHGIGTMVFAMDIRELQDDELVAQARGWRQWALRGEKDARGVAHELERQVRRRFPRSDAPHALPLINRLALCRKHPRGPGSLGNHWIKQRLARRPVTMVHRG